MKVYVFIFKRFYVSNCVDYPQAIDNDLIKIFKTREDAEIYRSKVFELDKAMKADSIRHTYDFEYLDGDAKVIRFLDASRYCYEIIEKNLE